MKKTFLIAAIFIPSLFVHQADAKIYVAEPRLVQQAPYAGMQFYVYRPYNMPEGWHLTFDGYAVKQTKQNVWVYGTFQGNSLVETVYVVGSVNPGLAGLVPYTGDGMVSSTIRADSLLAEQPKTLGRGVGKAVYIPDWSVNPQFLAIANWRKLIDRVGILHKINMPVAWSGERPKTIYAWTGEDWYQMNAEAGDREVDTLRRNLYALTKIRNKTHFQWHAEDTPVLIERVNRWGFYWMGEVTVQGKNQH